MCGKWKKAAHCWLLHSAKIISNDSLEVLCLVPGWLFQIQWKMGHGRWEHAELANSGPARKDDIRRGWINSLDQAVWTFQEAHTHRLTHSHTHTFKADVRIVASFTSFEVSTFLTTMELPLACSRIPYKDHRKPNFSMDTNKHEESLS